MATYSKVFSINSAYTLYLDVSESSYSIENNNSVVAWTLRVHSDKALQYGSWDYTTADVPYSVYINGSRVASGNRTYDFRNYKDLTVASGTTTVAHNEDGTKVVACSGSYCASGSPIGTASVSGNFTLTTIPRYSDITVSDPVEMGVVTSVTVTQKSADFSHILYYSIDDGTTYTEIGRGTATGSYSWTPADTASSLPNADSTTYKLKCETYLTNDYTGSTLDTVIDVTANVPSGYVPTISIGTITEGNSNVPNDFPFVVGYSKLTIPTTASGNHNSTVTSRSVTVGNETKTSTATGTVSLTMDKALTGTTNIVTANVTDSRGRTGTASTSVSALAYSLPAINELDVTRCTSGGATDPLGTYVVVRVTWDWTSVQVSGSEKNSAVIKIYVDDEASPRTTYTTLTNSQQTLTQVALLSGIQTASQYTITVRIEDELGYTVRQQLVSKAVMPLSLYDDGTDIGVTIGRMATQGGFNNWLDLGLVTGKNVNLYDANAQQIDTMTTDSLFDKQDTLVSGTNIKTINGSSILGSGDLTLGGYDYCFAMPSAAKSISPAETDVYPSLTIKKSRGSSFSVATNGDIKCGKAGTVRISVVMTFDGTSTIIGARGYVSKNRTKFSDIYGNIYNTYNRTFSLQYITDVAANDTINFCGRTTSTNVLTIRAESSIIIEYI